MARFKTSKANIVQKEKQHIFEFRSAGHGNSKRVREYRQREFLQLYLEGLEVKRIAEIANMHPQNVRVDIQQAMQAHAPIDDETTDRLRLDQFDELETLKLIIWDELQDVRKPKQTKGTVDIDEVLTGAIQKHLGQKINRRNLAVIAQELKRGMQENVPERDDAAIERLSRSYIRACERQAKLMALDKQLDIHIHHEVQKNVVIQAVDYRKALPSVSPKIEYVDAITEDEDDSDSLQ